jgi:hypothetical protein
LVFPDLNKPPFGGEDFQTNLIMPEPTEFLSPSLTVCSIIRPTATEGAANGALTFLTNMGLFLGQSPGFFSTMQDLAKRADAAGAARAKARIASPDRTRQSKSTTMRSRILPAPQRTAAENYYQHAEHYYRTMSKDRERAS